VGVHHSEHGLAFDINRRHRMAEEARRLAIACWSQTFAPARSSAEIDLGRILGGNDPPSGTRAVRLAAVFRISCG